MSDIQIRGTTQSAAARPKVTHRHRLDSCVAPARRGRIADTNGDLQRRCSSSICGPARHHRRAPCRLPIALHRSEMARKRRHVMAGGNELRLCDRNHARILPPPLDARQDFFMQQVAAVLICTRWQIEGAPAESPPQRNNPPSILRKFGVRCMLDPEHSRPGPSRGTNNA